MNAGYCLKRRYKSVEVISKNGLPETYPIGTEFDYIPTNRYLMDDPELLKLRAPDGAVVMVYRSWVTPMADAVVPIKISPGLGKLEHLRRVADNRPTNRYRNQSKITLLRPRA